MSGNEFRCLICAFFGGAALVASAAAVAPVAPDAAPLFDRWRPMFLGCNYWASHAGVYMWRDWRPDVIERDLDRLAAQGMTVLRVFPLWPDFQPLKAEFGGGQSFHNYTQGDGPLQNAAGVDETMMARFRFLCDAAEKRGIRLIVGLITGWMSGRTFVPPAFERMKVLSEPEAVKWQVRFVRHFVNALKDHSAIAAWDLGNECNCLAGGGDSALWTWMHQIAAEIRCCDATRPVVSGMHSCTTKRTGTANLREQGELVDVLTTHPYPLWTPDCNLTPFDTIRNGTHAACETTLYADLSGRTAFVEEAGSMGPQIVSEERAAATMRMQLLSSWACGVPGYVWWCAFDQGHLPQAPYDWTAIERELGLFRADGTPKPTARTLCDFKAFLRALPFAELPPRQIDAVVIAGETVNCWRQMQGAWLLSRMAGFDIRYAFAESELPEASFYILPSNEDKYNAYTRRAVARVLEKAKGGATVLITLGNGSIFADLEAVTGVRTEVHYARPRSCRVTCPRGEFELRDACTREITPVGSSVLARDDAGRPVMTAKAYGRGKVLFFNGALETEAQETGWPAYALAAREAGVSRRIVPSVPTLGITEHRGADGTVRAVAVNYDHAPVASPLPDGWSVEAAFGSAEVRDGTLRLGANDGCVLKLRPQPPRAEP